jgi:hypothetical protein
MPGEGRVKGRRGGYRRCSRRREAGETIQLPPSVIGGIHKAAASRAVESDPHGNRIQAVNFNHTRSINGGHTAEAIHGSGGWYL